MSEPSIDRRAPPPISIKATATASGAVGIMVAFGDWLLKCQHAHSWVAMDNALMVMLMTALAPIAHLLLKIVINKLEQLAEQKANG